MRYKLQYTSIKPDVKAVKDKFKEWGVTMDFDVSKSNLDETAEVLYETSWSWSGLLFNRTKSISSRVMALLAGDEPFILCVDASKSLQKESLRGQHSTYMGKRLIEVYQKPHRYIRDIKNPSRETQRKTNWHRDTYVIIHEILHDLEKLKGKNNLHKEIDKGNFEEYAQEICSWYKDEPKDLLPLVKKRWKILERIMSEVFNDPIKLVEGYRSCEKQNKYFNEGKTKARCGESMHQYGIAIDYCFNSGEAYPPADDPRWLRVNTLAEALGFYSYGINLGWDYGHIQLMLDYKSEKELIRNFDASKYNI